MVFEKFKKQLKLMKSEEIETAILERRKTLFKHNAPRSRMPLIDPESRKYRTVSQFPYRKVRKEIQLLLNELAERCLR